MVDQLDHFSTQLETLHDTPHRPYIEAAILMLKEQITNLARDLSEK